MSNAELARHLATPASGALDAALLRLAYRGQVDFSEVTVDDDAAARVWTALPEHVHQPQLDRQPLD